MNTGNTPTFDVYRGNRRYTSRVDVTVCSVGLAHRISNWRVNTSLVSSDHNAIMFNLELDKKLEEKRKNTTRRYNTKKAKWDQFTQEFVAALETSKISREKIKEIDNKRELNEAVGRYTDCVKRAADAAVPLISINGKR